MIGQIVTVIVDRPIGSYHPEHPDLYYPVNYGYIKGTMVTAIPPSGPKVPPVKSLFP